MSNQVKNKQFQSMGQQNAKQSLVIKIIQGDTQSHQLFDFQQLGSITQQSIVHSPSFIVSDGETVQYQQTVEEESRRTATTVFQINETPYKQIYIKDIGRQAKILWRVIQQGQSYPLKIGDTVKIGKIKMQLKRLVCKKSDSNQQETVKDQKQSLIGEHNVNDDMESVRTDKSSCDRCRICFRSFNNKTDPLVCLCKCSGSIKFIHYSCLKDWISNNVTKRQDDYCKFYSYFESSCQLCKDHIPAQFTRDGKIYSLFAFQSFEPPFAQFQYSQFQNNKKKTFKYIINLANNKEISMGRNNSSQVVMKDISISRMHCSLQYKEGLLIIRDKKSKFGTLVKVDKNLEFSSQTGLMLQFDSKIVELYQKGSFKNCCCIDFDSYKVIFEPSGILPREEVFDRNPPQVLPQLVGEERRDQNQNQSSSLSLSQVNFDHRATMVRDNEIRH